MPRVEEIPCKTVPMGKGEYGFLPERSIDLRPGDFAEPVSRGGQTYIEVHRAGFLRRLWHGLRGSV